MLFFFCTPIVLGRRLHPLLIWVSAFRPPLFELYSNKLFRWCSSGVPANCWNGPRNIGSKDFCIFFFRKYGKPPPPSCSVVVCLVYWGLGGSAPSPLFALPPHPLPSLLLTVSCLCVSSFRCDRKYDDYNEERINFSTTMVPLALLLCAVVVDVLVGHAIGFLVCCAYLGASHVYICVYTHISSESLKRRFRELMNSHTPIWNIPILLALTPIRPTGSIFCPIFLHKKMNSVRQTPSFVFNTSCPRGTSRYSTHHSRPYNFQFLRDG